MQEYDAWRISLKMVILFLLKKWVKRGARQMDFMMCRGLIHSTSIQQDIKGFADINWGSVKIKDSFNEIDFCLKKKSESV